MEPTEGKRVRGEELCEEAGLRLKPRYFLWRRTGNLTQDLGGLWS